MAYGKELLDLTLEYRISIESQSSGVQASGRTPEEIGKEYERVLLNMLAPDLADIAPEHGGG